VESEETVQKWCLNTRRCTQLSTLFVEVWSFLFAFMGNMDGIL